MRIATYRGANGAPRTAAVIGAAGAEQLIDLHDATGGAVPGAFEVPSSVHRIEIDRSSGAVALAGCPRREQEYFVEGTEPRVTCPEGGWLVRGDEQRDDDSARGARDSHGKTRPPGGWLDRLFGRWF